LLDPPERGFRVNLIGQWEVEGLDAAQIFTPIVVEGEGGIDAALINPHRVGPLTERILCVHIEVSTTDMFVVII
jgi:hypothetical protein